MYPSPSRNEKVGFWVKVTFWFWLMNPPPSQFCPICNFSNLFPLKWLRMTWNGQFCLFRPIHSFSNLFPPKWLRMTQNGQFHLICNFCNLFALKWLRMTWNGQFCPIYNFSQKKKKKKPTVIQGNFYERLKKKKNHCDTREFL